MHQIFAESTLMNLQVDLSEFITSIFNSVPLMKCHINKDIKRGNFKHQNGYIVELPAGNAHKIYGRLRTGLPSSQRTEFVPLKCVKKYF